MSRTLTGFCDELPCLFHRSCYSMLHSVGLSCLVLGEAAARILSRGLVADVDTLLHALLHRVPPQASDLQMLSKEEREQICLVRFSVRARAACLRAAYYAPHANCLQGRTRLH